MLPCSPTCPMVEVGSWVALSTDTPQLLCIGLMFCSSLISKSISATFFFVVFFQKSAFYDTLGGITGGFGSQDQ